MVHYKPVKIIIDILGLAEVSIDVIVYHHKVPTWIVKDQGSLFTSKFWSSLCYFLKIKKKLSTAFHLQIDGQTKRQNSMIEVYLRLFFYCEQNNEVKLLPMAEFADNNTRNASTSYTPFKLNCGYHPRILFEKVVDPHSRFCSAD